MTRNEQPGFDPDLYDADFYVWTQRQAAALRAMPADPAVDMDHVAEEIEDLGERDLREVGSFLALLIEHLLKVHALPSSSNRRHWLSEAGNFQDSAIAALTPGMRQLLDVGKIWARGRKRASISLRGLDEAKSLPLTSPLELDALLSEDFDMDAALARLASVRDGSRDHEP